MQDFLQLKSNERYSCRMHGLGPTDMYQRTDEIIHLSRFAITNGHGDICAHELGHWLSDQLAQDSLSEHSTEKMMSVRKCVQDFYPKESVAKFWFIEGDKKRTEEDFADWVQSQVGTESGLFCDMKKVIGMFGIANNELYPAEELDVHSNFLFREITVKLNRGDNLPKICHDVMEAYPGFRPGKCELK